MRFIAKAIDSILNQTYSNIEIEIIIADGFSNDGTREIIKSFQNKYQNIFIINNPEKYVPAGFNRALNNAHGEVIIRIDGHAEIEPDFIYNCIKIMEVVDADCVGGAIKHVSNTNIGQAIVLAQSSKFGSGGASFREKNLYGKYVGTLAFGAYKRKVFEMLGGYDEELIRNQDDEFNFRMVQNNMKLWLDPSIKSKYYPRDKFSKLFFQYFGYGQYKVRVMQKRRGYASWRHLVPSSFVFSLGLSLAIFLLNKDSFFFFLIFGSYLVLAFSSAFIEIYKNNRLQEHLLRRNLVNIKLFLIPLAYFTMHFSYGLGFLYGLVLYTSKWMDREVKDFHFDKNQYKKNFISS